MQWVSVKKYAVPDLLGLKDTDIKINFKAMSGEVSDETFQGIGHMIGLEHIITGSIERIGKVYRFRVW
ncbi:MAG: penicillin-binding protein activator LpoB, partial [Treponema sp.]|nr:penicillin-binding protein activator LpoB [Treponema sp.]